MEGLSNDARLVRLSLFGMGSCASVTFQRPHAVNPRAIDALLELEKADLIAPISQGDLPRGAVGWKATDKIGLPLVDDMAARSFESFPMLLET